MTAIKQSIFNEPEPNPVQRKRRDHLASYLFDGTPLTDQSLRKRTASPVRKSQNKK